jgi:hypothetical protein
MANAVPDTQLGLSNDEIALLRQHQAAAAAAGGSSSSRAASRASSQGLFMIDSSSLAALGRHFDRVMLHITNQLDALTEQTQIVSNQMYDHAGNLIEDADAAIAAFAQLCAQIEELELEMDKISNIREITRGFRRRAEELERDFDRSERSGNSSRREGHRSHGHSSHRSHGHSSSGRHRH